LDCNGAQIEMQGSYLLCDNGYHPWPCLIAPVKTGGPTIKWVATLESTRKDIEGVFGILKNNFSL